MRTDLLIKALLLALLPVMACVRETCPAERTERADIH